MALIYAKKGFTMKKGDIRIPWRTRQNVPDDDIIEFANGDPIYSKGQKWRTVFQILKFDNPEYQQKYRNMLNNPNESNIDVGDIQHDNGRMDNRDPNYKFERARKIEAFPILNDLERNALIELFDSINDIDGLEQLRETCTNRGEAKRWVDMIDSRIKRREFEKVYAAGEKAKSEMEQAKEEL